MATLFISKQDNRKANSLKSCSNIFCNKTTRFLVCLRLLLLAITILGVTGNAETLEKATIPAFPSAEGTIQWYDGMPDSWEKKFGLRWNDSSDGAEDADNDDYTNVEEWLNGTDPTRFVDCQEHENSKNLLR